MINGLLYGIVYFSVVPFLTLIAANFDLTFYPEQSFQTKIYDVNFSLVYVFTFIFLSYPIIYLLKSNNAIKNLLNINFFILKLRSKHLGFAILSILVIILEFVNFLYIDHSTHWLDRERLELIPASIRFYINPIFLFFTLISIINTVCAISLIRQRISYRISAKSYIWLALDVIFLIVAIYNSGNRWYLALMATFYFYISPKSEKKKILLLLPVIVFFGGIISFAMIANRVGIDPLTTVLNFIDAKNLYNSFITSLLTITEGFNVLSIIMLAEHKLTNFDPSYAILKILSLPLPSSIFDKPAPFNQVVARLLTNESGELSLGIGIVGIFIYSFGIISIPIFLILIFMVKYFDVKSNKNEFIQCLWFCVFFSGYRFGFEYLIVHCIYFSFLIRIFLK